MLTFAQPAAGVPLASTARALAHELLVGQPMRVHHCAGAARVATHIAHRLRLPDADCVIAAAWVHDVGYAQDLAVTGFHPVDGAVYLQEHGWSRDVIHLVAHHSHSSMVAPYYDAVATLKRFATPPALTADILTFADLAAGVDGCGVTIEERLMDMRTRHQANARVPEEVRERRYQRLAASARSVMSALDRPSRRRAR